MKPAIPILIHFIIILYAAHPSCAAFEGHFQGSSSTAMGGAGCASPLDAGGIFLNVASLSSSSRSMLTLFYSHPYGLSELAFGSIAVNMPVRWIDLGLGSQSYGNELYNEFSLGIAIAKKVHPRLHLGVAIWHNQLKIKNYGNTGTTFIDLGLKVQLHERLFWAVSVFNLTRAEIGRDNEKLPQILTSGVCFNPVPSFILNIDLVKDVHFPQELRFGIQFRPIPYILLRTGTGTGQTRFAAGLGLDYRFFIFEYSMTTHLDLGITHLVSVSIYRDKK